MDLNDPPSQVEQELDSEISSIRAEIRKLQRRRRFLSSSILSSEPLQNRLKASQQQNATAQTSLNDDISPLVHAAGTHAQSNHHRIAFSTTTFPFKDPSPVTETEDESTKNLIGVRIDICVRNGRFTKPYYLLLRRVRAEKSKSNQGGAQDRSGVRVRVHRHTIPAFIPVERLERVYLPIPPPVPDRDPEGENGGELKKKPTAAPRKQDLRAFIREIRRQLVAWHTRLDAVHYLRDQLGLVRRGVDEYPDEEEDGPWDREFLGEAGAVETKLKKNELGIVVLAPTALEASYVRVEWNDGRVGRFKISNSGLVERAVVIGDQGRDKSLEGVMTGGDRKVLSILDRLRGCASLSNGNEASDE